MIKKGINIISISRVAVFFIKLCCAFVTHTPERVTCQLLVGRIARLEHLMSRRPELLSSVMLRQNPHNVHEWHKRVKLFQGNLTKQIMTFTEAVKTVDSEKVKEQASKLKCAYCKDANCHKQFLKIPREPKTCATVFPVYHQLLM